MKEVAIFIGRFQIFHKGHLELIKESLTKAEKLLILLGSNNCPRTPKNPFNYQERKEFIKNCLKDYEGRIFFAPIDDYPYDDEAWTLGVENQVNKFLNEQKINEIPLLVGHNKDKSSFYLALFPRWEYLEFPNYYGLSATPIRTAYLRDFKNYPQENLPKEMVNFLDKFTETEFYPYLKDEQKAVDYEKEIWKNSPYPPVFSTVDAMVLWRDEVLLIERGQAPNKGLIAMPGGFIDVKESLFTSCLRELEEETGIKVNPVLWKKFLVAEKLYDDPERSARNRVITKVFCFRLPPDVEKPQVQGCDDAAKAFWKKLSELKAQEFHDDHFHIIREFCFKVRGER